MIVFRFKLSYFFIHMAYLIMPNCYEKKEFELALIEMYKRFKFRYFHYATAKEMFLFEQKHANEYAKRVKVDIYDIPQTKSRFAK